MREPSEVPDGADDRTLDDSEGPDGHELPDEQLPRGQYGPTADYGDG